MVVLRIEEVVVLVLKVILLVILVLKILVVLIVCKLLLEVLLISKSVCLHRIVVVVEVLVWIVVREIVVVESLLELILVVGSDLALLLHRLGMEGEHLVEEEVPVSVEGDILLKVKVECCRSVLQVSGVVEGGTSEVRVLECSGCIDPLGSIESEHL